MKKIFARKRYWVAGGTLAVLLLGVWFRHEIASGLRAAYRLLADRDRIEQLVTAFGDGAPLAFMGIQILQVIIAPVPGEATGFIGGYLFGSLKGFLYSTVALSLGSWINFGIGRFLGKRYVRGWIPDPTLQRFDHLAKRQGVIVMFILFVFPGFPKDYLCLFLGITAIPLKVFLIIASVGRMPGTLLLSLQGDFLFKKNYVVFAVVFAVTALVAFLTIRFRDAIYRRLEKLNGKSGTDR